MHANGEGVPPDDAEAAKWFRQAADLGHFGAQTNLGLMYYIGKGVPQDLVQAHMWFNIADALGDESAQEERDEVAKLMTPDQIAEAQRMASEWMAKHQR